MERLIILVNENEAVDRNADGSFAVDADGGEFQLVHCLNGQRVNVPAPEEFWNGEEPVNPKREYVCACGAHVRIEFWSYRG